MNAPYRSSEEEINRRVAYDLADPDILARVLYAEMRRGFVAVCVAHVAIVLAVAAVGWFSGARGWAAGVACGVVARWAWWLRGARRNLRCARLTREAAAHPLRRASGREGR